MDINFKFIFMSIIVLGLIVNTSTFSEMVFADKPNKEAAKEARDAAKDAREDAKEAAKDAREDAKEAAKDAREDAKEAREGLKEFKDGIVIASSSSSSIGKVAICHIPPGNPGNNHTISVGSPAVRAHLAHGDIDEPCDSADFEDYQAKKESKLADGLTNKELNALERAQKLIEKLEQQIGNLEKRLQNLMDKYESGEYYGNISEADDVTNSYVISFEGSATSVYDKSVETEMAGELVIENQVTTKDTSKFKVVSGEIEIGDATYDLVFGKARLSSSGPGGDEESLVIVLQTIDSEDNENTVKITLGFDSNLEGEFGDPSEKFEILENSKVSGQWKLNGSGQLKLES